MLRRNKRTSLCLQQVGIEKVSQFKELWVTPEKSREFLTKSLLSP